MYTRDGFAVAGVMQKFSISDERKHLPRVYINDGTRIT